MHKTKIGQRIKRVRESKGISLAELASRTNLKNEFLQALEEEAIYPSLGPLLKVSRAMGTRLGTFIDDKISKDPLLVKYEEREEELKTHTRKDKTSDLKFYSLGKGKNDRHMEPFYVRIMPETKREKNFSSHEGEEFIVVVSGEIEIVYGYENYRLKSGDSIYYNSIVPHNISCLGNEAAEIYAILYIPD